MAAAKQIVVFLMDKVTQYNCFNILEKIVDQFTVFGKSIRSLSVMLINNVISICAYSFTKFLY